MTKVAPFASVNVIGGGAWGTALAQLAAENGAEVLLWAREADVVAAINEHAENTRFLPGIPLNPRLKATADIKNAAQGDAILFVAPVQHARGLLDEDLRRHARADAPVALCSKGIEQSSGKLLTQVLDEVWPEAIPAVLSGPSFAKDVATGLPAAVTLACGDQAIGRRWIATLSAKTFRPYLSKDVTGAALGGAIKNVLAIATGIVQGRGLGESARAAVIARGFAEFQRLGVALGAQPETMAGLSGLGDLVLTAMSEHSRNTSLGIELGKGRPLGDILKERQTVSEGVATAAAVKALAAKAGVDMPIATAIADLVSDQKPIDTLIDEMLARPLKMETE